VQGVHRSPAPSRAAGSSLAAAAPAITSQVRPVLLVVDDDDGIREALHLILDDEYTVLDVNDGRTALAIVRAQHVDLMLLDILMPEVDGIEILHELRVLEPNLPVIMTTAVKTVLTAVTAMKLGAADYITKPFHEANLLAAVRLALEQRRPKPVAPSARVQPAHGTGLSLSRRVLLVEGDLGWRATLAVALERVGRVETAATLDEALNLVFRLRPTCVVLNVRRSSTDAARFLSALHAHLPACPVLVLSEDPHLQAMLAWESLNIHAVIRLPVDAGDVIGRITAVVCPYEDASRSWARLSVAVSRTIDYLSVHFGKELSVGDLARAAGISDSHLAHLFRAETGLTVRDYLTRVRVEITRDLLAHTDENLAEIAAFVGFFDASHLSRVFRQTTGKRPSVYRGSCSS